MEAGKKYSIPNKRKLTDAVVEYPLAGVGNLLECQKKYLMFMPLFEKFDMLIVRREKKDIETAFLKFTSQEEDIKAVTLTVNLARHFDLKHPLSEDALKLMDFLKAGEAHGEGYKDTIIRPLFEAIKNENVLKDHPEIVPLSRALIYISHEFEKENLSLQH